MFVTLRVGTAPHELAGRFLVLLDLSYYIYFLCVFFLCIKVFFSMKTELKVTIRLEEGYLSNFAIF